MDAPYRRFLSRQLKLILEQFIEAYTVGKKVLGECEDNSFVAINEIYDGGFVLPF